MLCSGVLAIAALRRRGGSNGASSPDTEPLLADGAFVPGARVVLHGLTGDAGLNGRAATVRKAVKHRLQVLLDGPGPVQTRLVTVKGDNLRPLAAGTPPDTRVQ